MVITKGFWGKVMSQTITQNRFLQFIENVLFEDEPQPSVEQVMIEPGTPYAVPRRVRRIDMLVGEAWISHLGYEVLLKRGQATRVDARQGGMQMCAVGGNPIVINQYR